jgi:hypothetical protein
MARDGGAAKVYRLRRWYTRTITSTIRKAKAYGHNVASDTNSTGASTVTREGNVGSGVTPLA